jgi:hypothetical protein
LLHFGGTGGQRLLITPSLDAAYADIRFSGPVPRRPRREASGEAWAGFELDLRNTLAALAPTGVLTETIGAYFAVGRKP